MAKRKYFKKPTPEQVAEYGLSIGFPLDGEEFCDFYASKGWKIGSSAMKDWQACVRTWFRNWRKRTGRPVVKSTSIRTAEEIQKEIEGERHA